ncbi:MAG: polysaccharide pyruvyl transferase family protein [Verrucomicrobiales bacterium]|nr:polysaccharide pyruvyl transferase family protein [Verrucomicrobiales bacterium]
MNRRHFLTTSIAASLVTQIRAAGSPKRIVLRSSWQTVNIGDIAHTPGVLHILEQHLPEVEVWLWPSKVDNGVDEILTARFPKLRILQGSDDLKEAFEQCEFLLHSSGASLVAERDVVKWREATGKPYGIYGITLPMQSSAATTPVSEEKMAQTIRVLSAARFVYFRDSHSLALAKEKGCTAPVMEFGPDGAFACDLTDDARAEAFLAANGLEKGRFVCCIPRLRYTPYWVIPEKKAAFDEVKHARNEAMKEHDHAQLREAVVRIARETDLTILLCPEDRTQMAVHKEMILDKLPEDVRPKVVWRPDYWLTGEAVSVYVRSAGLFGNEMHSPIMCIGHGIPAIVCRWAEQTSKGYMWEDIGLGDWLFNMDDEEQVKRVVPTVLAMVKDPEAAQAKAAKARAFVEQRQQATMQVLGKELASL